MRGTDKALRFILDRFFCDETNLIYDFLIDEGNAWHHLPKPEDINKQRPNPCGWGTGMEDCVLNGGSVLDGIVAEYSVTKNPKLKALSDKILKGMMLCATVSEDSGFVARGVSPFDGKSYYINSSRDQYTHWVYGAVRLFASPLSDEAQKEEIKKVIVAIAEKCLREVTPENDYNMLRADGKIGMVNKMWGDIWPHEYLRLPMFYMAAYFVSGDEKWKKLADKYKFEALDKTKPFKPFRHSTYVLLQLQYSLRFMYDLSEEEEYKKGCLEIMRSLSEYAEKKFDLCVERLKTLTLDFKYKKWNEVDWYDPGAEVGGYRYLNPAQSEWEENKSFYPLREVGETACVTALCPERQVREDIPETLNRVADSIDYENHYTYAPLLLWCGDKLCRENLG